MRVGRWRLSWKCEEEMGLRSSMAVVRGMAQVICRGVRERHTTQTPGTAYLPSAAFRNMTLALFWVRSTSGFLAADSAMILELGEKEAQLRDVGRQWLFQPNRKVSTGLIWMQHQRMMERERVRVCILLLCRSPPHSLVEAMTMLRQFCSPKKLKRR